METWILDGYDVPVYVVGPADAKTTVVFIHDIFSIHEGRVKALCDFLAELGYRVVFPDWHKGDSLDHAEDRESRMLKFGAWITAHPVDEVVRMFADTCNRVRGVGKKVAAIGFCWGTWVLYHAQKSGVAIDGCVCMHPSIALEDRLGGNHSDLLKA
jgi:dienelactone hydrolase